MRQSIGDGLAESQLAQLSVDDARERRTHVRARTFAFLLFVVPAVVVLASAGAGVILRALGR